MSRRAELESLPAATDALRAIRYMDDAAFDGITDDELEIAARWLRAAAHSAREGARTIEAVLARRKES